MFRGGLVRMPVVVQPRAVFVNMRVLSPDVRVCGRKPLAKPLADACKVQDPEQNQHQSDGKFHREPDARRDGQIKENNCGANQNDRDRVAETPKHSNPGGPGNRALAAHDGRDGDNVVRVRGMAHAQKKSNREYGESADHKGPGLAGARYRIVEFDQRGEPWRVRDRSVRAARRQNAPGGLQRFSRTGRSSNGLNSKAFTCLERRASDLSGRAYSDLSKCMNSAAACGSRAPRRETIYRRRGIFIWRTLISFSQPCSISQVTHIRGTMATPIPICTKRLMLSIVGISIGMFSAVRCRANNSITRRRKGDSTMCAIKFSWPSSSISTSRRLARWWFGGTTSVSSSLRISVACNCASRGT